jgi:hypothetical protein
MAEENEFVSVFRSADSDAEEQAGVIRDMLTQASIAAEIFDDSTRGVHKGVFEVRVPASQQAAAEEILASQKDFAPEALNLSHDLDMVTVFLSDSPAAEMQATQIRSILDDQGIASLLVSGSMFPSLPFEVRVPKDQVDAARQAIAAAEEAGPNAADEAERASEAGGSSVDLP